MSRSPRASFGTALVLPAGALLLALALVLLGQHAARTAAPQTAGHDTAHAGHAEVADPAHTAFAPGQPHAPVHDGGSRHRHGSQHCPGICCAGVSAPIVLTTPPAYTAHPLHDPRLPLAQRDVPPPLRPPRLPS